MPISVAALRALEAAIGRQRLVTASHELTPYSHDATPLLIGRPAAVAIARSTAEVQAVMRIASRWKIPVVPRGAGTGLSGGAVPSDGALVLDVTSMDRILEIDRQNRTARVEPGVTTAQLQEEARIVELFYPPDPGSASECTLGGNVAENAGGIRGLKYGVTRDYVLGLEVVLPSGELLRLGGKAIKDVSGYNLKDLMIGSEGTLGIFTQILLRLLPAPTASATWLVSFSSMERAGNAVAAILESRITPACLELMDRTTWQAISRWKGESLAAPASAFLLIELDGTRETVRAESARLSHVLKKARVQMMIRAQNAAQAEQLKSARRCAFTALSALGSTAILEDATVPRSAVPEMIGRMVRIARRHQVVLGIFGHAGDGNLHPTALIDGRRVAERRRAAAAFKEIYQNALRLGGTITGEHGVGLTKREALVLQWPPSSIELLRRVKQAFDPQGILNPGKIFKGRPKCEIVMKRAT